MPSVRRMLFSPVTAKLWGSAFAHHVVEINQALRAGYRCASDIECATTFKNPAQGNRT
jgi:hypothetical protein